MNKRLIGALIAYALLTVAAFFMVSGKALLVVLIVVAFFLAKTLLYQFKPPD